MPPETLNPPLPLSVPCLASLWGVGCGRGGSAGAGGGTGLSPAVLFAAAGRTQVAGG